MAENSSAEPTPEQQARIAEMKAKIAALKAQKGEPASEAGTPAAAPATPTASSDATAGSAPTPEQEARAAEMRAKIAAAKAAREGGAETAVAVAPAPAPGVSATPPPPSPPATARPAAPSGTAGAAKPKQVKAESEEGVWFFGRRNFLHSIGWMSFMGFFSIMILGTLRAMFPRVIYEKPPIFKAGFPGDFVPGTVSEKYKDEERVWIVRQTDGTFIALLAICTHLGCTPRWLAAENKFKCPCHGSGFRGAPSYGVNFEGPAPRPLERLSIQLAPDGQIEIDKSKKFLWEKGQWEDAGATLKV